MCDRRNGAGRYRRVQLEMSNLLLVVDMLNGFLEPGRNLYCGDHAREIIPNVKALIEREVAVGSGVIFICDTHDPDDL